MAFSPTGGRRTEIRHPARREQHIPAFGSIEGTGGPGHSGVMQSIEPGIPRFRVWCFAPSQNDTLAYFGCSFSAAELMQ
jgi:hypothetical protein